jgi:hypothetical protein
MKSLMSSKRWLHTVPVVEVVEDEVVEVEEVVVVDTEEDTALVPTLLEWEVEATHPGGERKDLPSKGQSNFLCLCLVVSSLLLILPKPAYTHHQQRAASTTPICKYNNRS